MKRGQLSAEMLILLVLILALVAIVYTRLVDVANTGGDAAAVRANDIRMEKNFCADDNACATDVNGKVLQGSQLKCENDHCVKK